MRLKRLGLAVVVLGLIALLTTPAEAQTRDDEERKPKLERLWRLYPLDPEDGEEDRALRSKSDTPAPAPPVTSDSEQAKEPGESISNADSRGMSEFALVFLTLLGVGLLLVGLVARKSTRGAAIVSLDRERGSAFVPMQAPDEWRLHGDRAPFTLQQPAELSHVRVHLRDGRVVQGKVKHAATRDQPVLLLEVIDVADSAGRKTEPDPLDAFLPLAEVGHVETIDEVNSPSNNGTEER